MFVTSMENFFLHNNYNQTFNTKYYKTFNNHVENALVHFDEHTGKKIMIMLKLTVNVATKFIEMGGVYGRTKDPQKGKQ